MQIDSKVKRKSKNGDTMRGRFMGVTHTTEINTPNRTDIAAGIPEDKARRFTATRTFGDVVYLYKGKVFKRTENIDFLWADPNRTPIEGLDVLEGVALSADQLIDIAMDQQAAATGAADGTAVEVPA